MEVLELTRQLVAIDSQNPGASEPEIAHFVANWCRDHGLNPSIEELTPGRPNVLVTIDHGGTQHLGLGSHLDTKPVGDAITQWHTDPLKLTVKDGLAYGLGTTDMKGALAAMLLATAEFAASSRPGTLSLIMTADEEQGSDAGAQSLVEQQRLPELDGLLIGEPSGIDEPWENLFLVSRGICCFWVDIETTQGHSGLSPRFGRNAILVAADLLKAFEEFSPPVENPGEVPCQPTMNSGMLVEGGVCFGVWPGSARIGIEIRTVPGMNREQVYRSAQELATRIAGSNASATIKPFDGSMAWMPASELSPQHQLVQCAQEAAMKVLGRQLPIAAYPGGTDAGYFMGRGGIPTVSSLGPGWLSLAHGANECVGVSQLDQAVDLYQTLIQRFFTPER